MFYQIFEYAQKFDYSNIYIYTLHISSCLLFVHETKNGNDFVRYPAIPGSYGRVILNKPPAYVTIVHHLSGISL